MIKKKALFTFPSTALRDPIIYNLSNEFDIATNILRAELSEEKGWISLELEGSKENLEAGIAWATSRGVRIDELESEVILR